MSENAQENVSQDQTLDLQSMDVTQVRESPPMSSEMICEIVEESLAKMLAIKAEQAHYDSIHCELGEKRRVKNAMRQVQIDQEQFNEIQEVTVQLISEFESSLSVIAGKAEELREFAGEAFQRNEELKLRVDKFSDLLASKNEKNVQWEEQEADLIQCLAEVANDGRSIEEELGRDRNGEMVALVEQLSAENESIEAEMWTLSRLLDEKAVESEQNAAKVVAYEKISTELEDKRRNDASAMEFIEKRLLTAEKGVKEDSYHLKQLKIEVETTKAAKRGAGAELNALEEAAAKEIRGAENEVFKMRGEAAQELQAAEHEVFYRLKVLQESVDQMKANSHNLMTEQERLTAELEGIMNETTTLTVETDKNRKRQMELSNAIKRKEAEMADRRFEAKSQQHKVVVRTEMKEEEKSTASKQPTPMKRPRAKKEADEDFQPSGKKKQVAVTKPMPPVTRPKRSKRVVPIFDNFDDSDDEGSLAFSTFARGLNR